MLNTIGELYFRLHHSRWFALACIAILIGCVFLIAGARADASKDLYNVSEFTRDANLSTLLNRYVSISGQIDRSNTRQVQNDVIGVQVRGTRFVGLNVTGRDESIMVLDDNLPQAGADGNINLIGIIRGQPDGAAQYPPYYLDPEKPVDIPLNNLLARLSLLIAVLTLLLLLGGWLVQRSNYALAGGRANDSDYAGPVLWFGKLGSRFQNATARHVPVNPVQNGQETRLDALAAGQPWSVSIRRVQQQASTMIATAYGSLPAMRLTFEDERGLTRQGVIAGNQRAIQTLTEQLSQLK